VVVWLESKCGATNILSSARSGEVVSVCSSGQLWKCSSEPGGGTIAASHTLPWLSLVSECQDQRLSKA
jgi:hypothetical protein